MSGRGVRIVSVSTERMHEHVLRYCSVGERVDRYLAIKSHLHYVCRGVEYESLVLFHWSQIFTFLVPYDLLTFRSPKTILDIIFAHWL